MEVQKITCPECGKLLAKLWLEMYSVHGDDVEYAEVRRDILEDFVESDGEWYCPSCCGGDTGLLPEEEE